MPPPARSDEGGWECGRCGRRLAEGRPGRQRCPVPRATSTLGSESMPPSAFIRLRWHGPWPSGVGRPPDLEGRGPGLGLRAWRMHFVLRPDGLLRARYVSCMGLPPFPLSPWSGGRARARGEAASRCAFCLAVRRVCSRCCGRAAVCALARCGRCPGRLAWRVSSMERRHCGVRLEHRGRRAWHVPSFESPPRVAFFRSLG